MNWHTKRILKMLSIVALILFIFVKVEAFECTREDKLALKKEAAEIEFVPILDDTFNPMHEYFYSFNFLNFSEKFYIVDSNGEKFTYYDEHTSDTLYGIYREKTKVVFKIYGAYRGTCSDVLLATRTITLKKYNDYAQHDACAGIEEFYLCNSTYQGEIESEHWFLEQVEIYKQSLEEKPEVIEPETSSWEETKKVLNENIDIIITIIVVILLLVALLIFRKVKNRNKIKIDLGEEG